MRKTKLERLLADPDCTVMEAIIAYLRSRTPALVPTAEIAHTIGRSKAQVYGLIKKARELLRETTGEFLPNTAKRKNKKLHGYTVTKDYRAAEFEATKSFDRADGHLAQGIATHRRVPREAMDTPENVELWLANQNRSLAAEFFLKAGENSRTVMALKGNNQRLSIASRNESLTPWEEIGLEAPRAADDDFEGDE